MSAYREKHSAIGIVEAVETLSSIAELESGSELGITEEHRLVVQDVSVKYRTVHWLHEQEAAETVKIVKEIFRIILDYLQSFYEDEYEQKKETFENVKTIMVLVGEAAQKLDKYTTIFKDTKLGSVTQLKEYKQLQDFYHNKISAKVEENFVKEWMKQLPQVVKQKPSKVKLKKKGKISTKHIFVDLEAVKQDLEYELFFMRKEDGTRFYNPRLIRNIKLVCDFGDYFGERVSVDPLLAVQMWLDKCLHVAAQNILQSVGDTLDYFCHEAMKEKDKRLVSCLNKAVMALMLSANARNLLHNSPVKSCHQYFLDFQGFLREALCTRQYCKMLAYPPKKNEHFLTCLLELVHALCRALFLNIHSYRDVGVVVLELIEKYVSEEGFAEKEEHNHMMLWSKLSEDYEALEEVVKRHPHGPLHKVLEFLQEFGSQYFDSLIQYNIPNHLFDIYLPRRKVSFLHLPSPTHQEYINKAAVISEFKGFLHSCREGFHKKHHLLINLQDRTSWREHYRCSVLEELHKHPYFKDELTVVTLTKDTDFYHQLEPYHKVNRAKVFFKHFEEHLKGVHSGYYFPLTIKGDLFPKWSENMINAIHQFFFEGKNVLSRDQRLVFIEIFYMLLELKLIEICKADSVSLTCKDAIDTGSAASAQLYAFAKLIGGQALDEKDREYLDVMLFIAPLMIRERNLLTNRFQRMRDVIKLIETKMHEMGSREFSKEFHQAFGKYYKKSSLNIEVMKPQL